jgi:D-amino peptidase
MKIFISADIEGVNGDCHWNETEIDKPGYEIFRKEMTREVVSCCKALMEAGVEEIYVRDAHDSARNINPNDLPVGVKLIRGWAGSMCDMMAYLDKSFDGAIMIGYHSPSRSEGNPLSHTLNLSHHNIKINGQIASEYLLNTYYAQLFNVPVILVSGDKNLCELVKKDNGKIETVATKTGIHGAVVSEHPDVTSQQIYDQTKTAIENLKKQPKACLIPMPETFDCEVCYREHKAAYKASFFPGAHAISGDETGFRSNDFHAVLTFISFTVK